MLQPPVHTLSRCSMAGGASTSQGITGMTGYDINHDIRNEPQSCSHTSLVLHHHAAQQADLLASAPASAPATATHTPLRSAAHKEALCWASPPYAQRATVHTMLLVPATRTPPATTKSTHQMARHQAGLRCTPPATSWLTLVPPCMSHGTWEGLQLRCSSCAMRLHHAVALQQSTTTSLYMHAAPHTTMTSMRR
jgi:hypothetical protein